MLYAVLHIIKVSINKSRIKCTLKSLREKSQFNSDQSDFNFANKALGKVSDTFKMIIYECNALYENG